MDLNRLMNMVINQIVRRGVNFVVDRGINLVTRRGATPPKPEAEDMVVFKDATPPTYLDDMAKQAEKRARMSGRFRR